MKVFWHGQCIWNTNGSETWKTWDPHEVAETIAKVILALDEDQAFADLVDHLMEDPQWFIEETLSGAFKDLDLEDFMTDAVDSALAFLFSREHGVEVFGLTVEDGEVVE